MHVLYVESHFEHPNAIRYFSWNGISHCRSHSTVCTIPSCRLHSHCTDARAHIQYQWSNFSLHWKYTCQTVNVINVLLMYCVASKNWLWCKRWVVRNTNTTVDFLLTVTNSTAPTDLKQVVSKCLLKGKLFLLIIIKPLAMYQFVLDAILVKDFVLMAVKFLFHLCLH